MGKGITYSTSGRDCPCCGCQERAVGCHGTCDQYKTWDGKRQAEKLERFRKTSILHEADKRKSAAVSHYKKRSSGIFETSFYGDRKSLESIMGIIGRT